MEQLQHLVETQVIRDDELDGVSNEQPRLTLRGTRFQTTGDNIRLVSESVFIHIVGLAMLVVTELLTKRRLWTFRGRTCIARWLSHAD